ncbi:TPA: hypothetical protein ACUP18_003297, partial [Escherichia coli]
LLNMINLPVNPYSSIPYRSNSDHLIKVALRKICEMLAVLVLQISRSALSTTNQSEVKNGIFSC